MFFRHSSDFTMCFYPRAALIMLNLDCTFSECIVTFSHDVPEEAFAFFFHTYLYGWELETYSYRLVLIDHKCWITNAFVNNDVHICFWHWKNISCCFTRQVVCDHYETVAYLYPILRMYEYVCDLGISLEITVLQTSCTQAVLCTFYFK